MPDPHKDLADIVEPALNTTPPAEMDLILPLGLALAGVLLALAIWWSWRRRAPLRTLRRLATAADPQAGAEALYRLMAPILEPSPGLGIPPLSQKGRPDKSSASNHAPFTEDATQTAWRQDLERLRFGPPSPDAAATLARLCREAEAWLKPRP
jgi:hypothetical protein